MVRDKLRNRFQSFYSGVASFMDHVKISWVQCNGDKVSDLVSRVTCSGASQQSADHGQHSLQTPLWGVDRSVHGVDDGCR